MESVRNVDEGDSLRLDGRHARGRGSSSPPSRFLPSTRKRRYDCRQPSKAKKLTGGIAFGKETDFDVSHDEVSVIVGNVLVVLAMDAVVFEQIGRVIDGQERIVDPHDSRIGVVERRTHHQTSDPSKSVDTKFRDHLEACLVVVSLLDLLRKA